MTQDDADAFGRLPVRQVRELSVKPMARTRWPATLAPVRQLLDDGLDLGAITVLVGDNGAGKSTMVEAIAAVYGLNPEGGSTSSRYQSRVDESGLAEHLQLVRNGGASKRGFFLRAETMHGFFTYLESIGDSGVFHERSHGESFLDIVVERSRISGLWILDEPESALSFSGCLALIGILKDLVASGKSQVILSTHSPVLAAFPGAVIHEVGDWGLRRSEWADLDLVRNLSLFLDAPGRFLRHV